MKFMRLKMLRMALVLTAHNAAMRRIEQVGAVPMTALQVLLEYQRDWSRKETYDAVIEL